MNLLTDDIKKFVNQTSAVKDAIIDTVFKDREYVTYKNANIYLEEKRMIIGISDDVAYLCRWNDVTTIIIFRHEDKCRVKLSKDGKCLKSFYIKTDDTISKFTMMMDYYEIENIITYSNLNGKLKNVSF